MMTDSTFALVLTGGGASGAYQVGFLRYLASRYPDLSPGILTGVSAGGIIATHLASREGTIRRSVGRADGPVARSADAGCLPCQPARAGLARRAVGTSAQSVAACRIGTCAKPGGHDAVARIADGDTRRAPGWGDSCDCRRLRARPLDALALTASSYSTGQSVTWVQKREGCGLLTWEQPKHQRQRGSFAWITSWPPRRCRSSSRRLRLMAPGTATEASGWPRRSRLRFISARAGSSRSPRAIRGRAGKRIGRRSKAIRRRRRSPARCSTRSFWTCSMPMRMQLDRIKRSIDRLPHGPRPAACVIWTCWCCGRPGISAALPTNSRSTSPGFPVSGRGLGSRETRSNDMLSLLMFQPEYLARLIELGESDARARAAEIDAFMADEWRAMDTAS